MRAAGISVAGVAGTSRLDSLLVRLSRDAGFLGIVLARHEGGAGHLAGWFARASGKLLRCLWRDSGATNVISAVAYASVNQVPRHPDRGRSMGLHSQDTSDDGLAQRTAGSAAVRRPSNRRQCAQQDSAFRALASIPVTGAILLAAHSVTSYAGSPT